MDRLGGVRRGGAVGKGVKGGEIEGWGRLRIVGKEGEQQGKREA